MSEINLGRLGKNKIDIDQLKAGLKQSDMDKSEYQIIFSKIDTDNNGVIDQNEISAFKENLQLSAGNSRLNNREANKLLKNMGAEDVSAKDLFEFLQIGVEQSKNIKSTQNISLGGDSFAINIEYQPDENGNINSSLYNMDGKKISDTVKYKNSVKLSTVYYEDGRISHYEKTQGAVKEFIDTSNRILKKEITKADGVTDAVFYDYADGETQPYKETLVQADGTITVKEQGYTTTVNPDGSIVSDNPELNVPTEDENNGSQKLSSGRILITEQDENGNSVTYIKENENSEPVKIRYDEDGNILSNAKEGESFARTAKRLGIEKGTPEYEKFKELNKRAAKKGWFIVGAEVKIPAGMEDKINLEGLNVDARSEIDKYNEKYGDLTPSGSSKPVKPTKPARPTKPQKPTNSAPAEPTKPTTATSPAKPLDHPTRPTVPTMPTVPTAATTPAPTQATKPTSAEAPSTPTPSEQAAQSRPAKDVVNSLIDDIYATTSLGLPTTGKDIEKHIKEINSSNVDEILSLYKRNNKDKESLIDAILSERGLSVPVRTKYINHIKEALIQSAKKQGKYTDDISADFDKELKYQMTKVGFAEADFLDSFVDKLNDRKPVDINSPKPNGKIDKDFRQGNTGDCWLIASIKAIALTPKGLQILNDSIKMDNEGNVIVTLKGVGKTYKITPEQLAGNNQFSSGDMDVRALEIAMDRYFIEERGVRRRVDLNGNKEHVAFNLLTGKGGKNFLSDSYGRIPDIWITDNQINNFYKENHIACVAAVGKENLTFSSSDDGDKITLHTNHAYAVQGSDANNVYLINPWDTSTVIPVPRDKFKDFFNMIDEFDL